MIKIILRKRSKVQHQHFSAIEQEQRLQNLLEAETHLFQKVSTASFPIDSTRFLKKKDLACDVVSTFARGYFEWHKTALKKRKLVIFRLTAFGEREKKK